MKKLVTISLFAAFCVVSAISAANAAPKKPIELRSPDGQIAVTVGLEAGMIHYSVVHKGISLMERMPLSMSFSTGLVAGENLRAYKIQKRVINEAFDVPVKVKTSRIELTANELEVDAGDYSIIFRAYNDAVAYRFVTRFAQREVQVIDERVCYNFRPTDAILFPEESSFLTHQERKFIATEVGAIQADRFCSPPMLVSQNKVRILVTEVDLESYPGIFYEKQGSSGFRGIFPHYPAELKMKNDRTEVVVREENYIARCAGTRSYPWRVTLVTDIDTKLLESNTLYSLAAPSRVANTEWIKAGKIAWDWWNSNNLTGVPFRSGVNTETYKAFIDFAAQQKLEYIVLDEGWYDIKKTILDIVPEVDMQQITDYAKSKNIGVILWTTWTALDQKMEESIALFKKWDIKGVKIDFMQRCDQIMVDWYYSTAAKFANAQMLVDYHGAYTPRGLNRTYPNMMTSEGVYGLEQNKWTDDLTPEHNVTLAFTRMVLGPMDYTPGAMRNVRQEEFSPIFERPMSLGTRAHQLGMYVVYESPLQMLSDTPSAYNKESETMRFLSPVPAEWDETRALAAQLSDYVVIARRNGAQWWIGALNDWTARSVEVSLDFLGEGTYTLTMWGDGVNADRHAEDLAVETIEVTRATKLTINMASGGGFAATLRIKN